jgi:opacity protein-like surface antigen/outer membrane protease
MTKFLLAGVSLVALAFAVGARAADMPVKAPVYKAAPPLAAYDWTGFYTGLNVGAAWGSYDPLTSTTPDGVINGATARVNAAGASQNLNSLGFIGGSQAGYNWQWGHVVAGLEADLDYLHLNAATVSPSIRLGAATQVVIGSYGNANWLATVRPRLGWAAGNWLFYATGGLALTTINDDFTLTGGVPAGGSNLLQSGRIKDTVEAGYAVGGGIEAGITDRLSVKAEYLHVDFGRLDGPTTNNSHPTQIINQSADLQADMVRVGFNYRFGESNSLPLAYTGSPTFAAAPWVMPTFAGSNWEFDVGARTWLSSGTVGAPQPLIDNGGVANRLASRLLYDDLGALSGETYARSDHTSGWFAKGFLGAGGIFDGNLHDEDFPTGTGPRRDYSNTLSSASGNLGYANIDVGYAVLRAPGAKFGPFVGYNYFTQHLNTYGCQQLAFRGACTGAPQSNYLVISEDDQFSSVRVGLSAEFMLTDRLKFSGDAAYVPWTSFNGLDSHNARRLLLLESASAGDGVMLEADLRYAVTEHWNVGVGGRYWAWNSQTGTSTFDFIGVSTPPAVSGARYTTERYGVFLQSGYHWGDTTPTSAYASVMPVKAPAIAPMNWTGIYVGGHLGGGTSDSHWSDPFGVPTKVPGGGINQPGFGDTVHGTGPLAGGGVGANWQTGAWVLGVQADFDWTDIRGENTCFSGIGGINCQRIVDAASTFAGRIGVAWARSLLYAKVGGAWADTNFTLDGNTNILRLGVGSPNATAFGWMVGGGIEYAITNNWTTAFEYNHIDLSSITVPFPTVRLVNAQAIGVGQTLDIIKLGLNYKLF